MKRSVLTPALSLLVATVVICSQPPRAGVADDTPAKKTGQAFREMGKGFKEFGKKVGEAGRQVGLEVADAAKKVWYKGKQVSKPKLEQVQERTRGFWAKVIEGKDRSVEELCRENADLKKRLAEKKEDD